MKKCQERAFILLIMMAFSLPLQAEDDITFHGGYVVAGEPTLLLQMDGNSFWVREGVAYGDIRIEEIAADLSYIVLVRQGETIRIEVEKPNDFIPHVQKDPQAVVTDDAYDFPGFAELKASLQAIPRLRPQDIDVILRDHQAKMKLSALEVALAEGASLDEAELQRLTKEEAQAGNLLLWKINADGEPTNPSLIHWPNELRKDPETGLSALFPVGEEEARRFFAEQAAAYNREHPEG